MSFILSQVPQVESVPEAAAAQQLHRQCLSSWAERTDHRRSGRCTVRRALESCPAQLPPAPAHGLPSVSKERDGMLVGGTCWKSRL